MNCLCTLLSFDVDLGLKDYAGDTACEVAQIYNQQECLEVIAEHLKKQEDRSKCSPSARRGSRQGRRGSAKTTPTKPTASSPSGNGNFLDVNQPSDFDNVHFAHSDIQLPTDTVS